MLKRLFVILASASLLLFAACEADDPDGTGGEEGGGGSSAPTSCSQACADLGACFSSMSVSQCNGGCEESGFLEDSACLACWDYGCGQRDAFRSCLIADCGTPEDALE
jgi:hypothetical protein